MPADCPHAEPLEHVVEGLVFVRRVVGIAHRGCFAYYSSRSYARSRRKSHPLRIPRELRYRDREVMGRMVHRVGQHAGRGDSLVCRCRQPGVAVPRPRAVEASGRRRPSARLRQAQLFLGVHRRDHPVQPRRPVLDLRGRPQVAGAGAAEPGLGRPADTRHRGRARGPEHDRLPRSDQQAAQESHVARVAPHYAECRTRRRPRRGRRGARGPGIWPSASSASPA